jgi:hypothetical protein
VSFGSHPITSFVAVDAEGIKPREHGRGLKVGLLVLLARWSQSLSGGVKSLYERAWLESETIRVPEDARQDGACVH